MRLFPRRTEAKPDSQRWVFWRWFDIYGTGDVLYLRRLTILRTPWFQVLMHWIKKPDPDPDLHNHPWAFCTFVLRGSYVEQVHDGWDDFVLDTGGRRKAVRWFARKGLGDFHRIAWCAPRTTTLVITGPMRQSWGFLKPDGSVVPWREYLGIK